MQRRRHIQRLVIIVGALHSDESRSRIRAYLLKEIRQSRAAESSDYIPPLYTNVARVLADPRQRLHLRQFIFSSLLPLTANSQRPVLKIPSRIVHVIAVDRKLIERRNLGIVERRCQMPCPKQPRRSPVAES